MISIDDKEISVEGNRLSLLVDVTLIINDLMENTDLEIDDFLHAVLAAKNMQQDKMNKSKEQFRDAFMEKLFSGS